ncbi:MAG: trypsin-like peptidase domain-containing protein [Oscillospiraceae bacterium]|nr:trypsin-like peptidase domain-containing protein [Oscillospiraceae bacterium]
MYKERKDDLWQGGTWERPQERPEGLCVRLDRTRVQKEKQRARRRRRGKVVFTVFLLLIMVCSGVMAVLALQQAGDWMPFLPTGPTGQQSAEMPRAPLDQTVEMLLLPKAEQTLTLQELYERCSPYVVYIQARTAEGINVGSGIILTDDGYILTNAHILEGASAAQVVLHDDTVLEAKLVGKADRQDLAVLKVEGKDLPAARFSDSAQLQVGDNVVAIGNPLGSTLRGTMTQGIVSAINRSVDVDGVTMSLIQTTAALNPGNSGGALINDRGQVVGITTMKMMSSYETIEGLGFAIPSRFAKGIADQLIAAGEAKSPAIGILIVFQSEPHTGLRVDGVNKKSDAWQKGLRVGDIIVAANSVPLTNRSALTVIMEPMGVGDSLALTVQRGDRCFDMDVVLMDSQLFE